MDQTCQYLAQQKTDRKKQRENNQHIGYAGVSPHNIYISTSCAFHADYTPMTDRYSFGTTGSQWVLRMQGNKEAPEEAYVCKFTTSASRGSNYNMYIPTSCTFRADYIPEKTIRYYLISCFLVAWIIAFCFRSPCRRYYGGGRKQSWLISNIGGRDLPIMDNRVFYTGWIRYACWQTLDATGIVEIKREINSIELEKFINRRRLNKSLRRN